MLLSFISTFINGTANVKLFIAEILLSFPVILFALSFHEAAHGFVAYKCGDPTAKNLGRISLNPLRHLDPLGTLCMLLVGYGWAKPVPINPRNFKNPKRGMAISAAAGPLSNLLLGFLNAILVGLSYALFRLVGNHDAPMFVVYIFYLLFILFKLGTIYNFVFAVFNLLPLPPFDGSRIFYAVLPEKWYFAVMKYERTIMIVVLLVFLTLSNFHWFLEVLGLNRFLRVPDFNWSPVSLLAGKLYDWTVIPFANLFWKIFF